MGSESVAIPVLGECEAGESKQREGKRGKEALPIYGWREAVTPVVDFYGREPWL